MNSGQHTCKTTFAGSRNPFSGAYMPTKPLRRHADPETLKICDDPIPGYRAKPKGKYEEVFSQLKVGQCIKCQPEETGKIAHALRTYIAAREISAAVKSINNYGDGMGRVWLVAAPATPRGAK